MPPRAWTRRLFPLLVALAASTLAARAPAATLFDTGYVDCGEDGCGGGLSLGPHSGGQKVAGRFTLGSDAVITGIEVWIGLTDTANLGRTFTIALYGGDALPTPSAEFLAQSITVDFGGERYTGTRDLSVALSAGSYWISVETRPGDDYDGFVYSGGEVTNQFGPYAIHTSQSGWFQDELGEFAYVIEGDLAVPEPAAGAQLLLGLVALAARARLHHARRTAC